MSAYRLFAAFCGIIMGLTWAPFFEASVFGAVLFSLWLGGFAAMGMLADMIITFEGREGEGDANE